MNLQANDVKAWCGNRCQHPGQRNLKVCLLLATWCWHCYAPILKHYQDRGQTVNSSQYCVILEEEFKPTVLSKHWGMLTNWVVLHCGNAQTHIAAATIEMFGKLKFKLFLHPAYSPDLAQSDNHNFGLLNDVSHGCWFVNDENVKDADLQIMKMSRMWCICGFMSNQYILCR